MPRILLVDDERPNRRVLREIFEFEKFEVDEAEDGELGLAKILANEYDVVLLDIKMPKKAKSSITNYCLQTFYHKLNQL